MADKMLQTKHMLSCVFYTFITHRFLRNHSGVGMYDVPWSGRYAAIHKTNLMT